MIEDIKLLKSQGCSDTFIAIVEKYTNMPTKLEDLDLFVNELEQYKAGEAIHPFEESVFDLAKEKLRLLNQPTEHKAWNDDSTEAAIRRNEMDYTGDMFETMGYEMYTDDGFRY